MSRTYPTSQMQVTTVTRTLVSPECPKVDHVVSSSPTSGHIPTRAVVPTVGYPARPAHINPAHPRKVSPKRPERRQPSLSNPRKPRTPTTRCRRSVPKSTTTPDGRCRRSVPTDGNQARTSPRKLRTPTARYRRSVPSETGQATYASLQSDPKTKVSLERPVIELSPSWSVRLLATPRSGGPAVVGSNNTLVPPGVCGAWPLLAVWDPWCRPKQRRPSVLQTIELREFYLLLSPPGSVSNTSNSSAKPPRKPRTAGSNNLCW